MRLLFMGVLLSCATLAPAHAGTKTMVAADYRLPADKPVTVVLMRPDVQVGLLGAGGLAEPNADWTDAARTALQAALEGNQKARGIELRALDAQSADAAQLVGDYEALHRAVAASIVEHKYYGAKLPTKKERFDWTMGPGTQAIADLSGGNYALFVYSRDNFASDARKAMQVAGLLGCVIGFCMINTGGTHVAYALLVELSSGNVVWFNVLRGSKGDVREAEGARSMIAALMGSMPSRPGERAAPQVAAK